MARELGPQGIGDTALAPGLCHTDITEGLWRDARRAERDADVSGATIDVNRGSHGH